MAEQAINASIVGILPLVAAADKPGNIPISGWGDAVRIAASSARESGIGIEKLEAMSIDKRPAFIMQKKIKVFREVKRNSDKRLINKIVSGGQTGTDRAALDVAMMCGIPTGGWCPAGRRAEDGIIADNYQLTETTARNYATRTKWNVRDSDGTLVLNLEVLDGGTLETVEYARRYDKPCLVVQLDEENHQSLQEVCKWMIENAVHVLNVAGPRESKRAGIYQQSFDFLERLLTLRT